MHQANDKLTTTQEVKSRIKKYEGLRLTAYKCQAGVWTIGYGTTVINGRPVHPGLMITKEEAEHFFESDIARFEYGVKKNLDVPVNRNEFSAMVSLAYNIGVNNFKASSVCRYTNRGDKEKAAESFLLWNKARNPETGRLRELRGLTRRRKWESDMYLTPPAHDDVKKKSILKFFENLKALWLDLIKQ